VTVNGPTAAGAGAGIAFRLGDAGALVDGGHLPIDPQRRWEDTAPLVSCLMLSRDRPRLAARAMECFLAQSYPHRELVVVDSGRDGHLRSCVDAICHPSIRLHQIEPDGLSLGALRNLAIQQSRGQYLCTWDDDDLSDPDRLSVQMAAIEAVHADACFLTREQLWWPARRVLAVSTPRIWESTMVCATPRAPRYPPLPWGEDTPAAFRLWRSARVIMLDEPRLYTYVFHGANTCTASHFGQHVAAATQTWTGPAYDARLNELGARVPIDTHCPTPPHGTATDPGDTECDH
jgi:Glycosyl transferase family 2